MKILSTNNKETKRDQCFHQHKDWRECVIKFTAYYCLFSSSFKRGKTIITLKKYGKHLKLDFQAGLI